VVAPAAALEVSSLIPADPGTAPAPAVVVTTKPPDPNAPQLVAEAEWFLSEGVKGAGKAPDWFRADKYRSVAAQAEAYKGLEKKLGAFTGAPAEGKYEFKLPEGVDGEFDTEHPMYQSLVKTAAEMQISNEGFNRLLGMFAQYEAGLAPNPAASIAAAKTALGETADARITATSQWIHANLGPDLFNEFRKATDANELSGEQMARVVKIVEAAINKGRVQMPKPGEDVPAQTQGAEQELAILHEKKGPDGKPLYFTDPQHRVLVDRKRVELQNLRGAA
jgi:hypothetical protein